MENVDKVTPKGYLKIQVCDSKTGKEIRELRVAKPNLITQGSKKALSRLLTQDDGVTAYDPTHNRLWALHVGDDNTAPATTQLALQAAVNVTKREITSFVITGEYSGVVEIEVTLSDTEHNDKYLRECGLFTRGTLDDPATSVGVTMLARQIHGEIHKTAAITVKYTWCYQITT